jgi:hypothetical protein
MKQMLFWMGILIIVVACSTQKGAVISEQDSDEKVVEDSLEYGIETFDHKFKTWYTMHNNSSQYRSQDYYESWNRQYISAWNSKAMGSGKNSFFEPIVGFDSGVDYGFELNHELFHYFQYVENVLKIKIMSGGPGTGLY